MSGIHCHRCGRRMGDGDLKYQVAVRVRSLSDGVIPETDPRGEESELESILNQIAPMSEEDLTRQVYEDDVFIMCPECKEAFLENIYSHLHPQATPEHGRAHLIH